MFASQGLCRLLSDVKAFLESPDAPPSMPSQRPAALQEHVKALEQQDVILAINRSHEHFDHKGASKLGRHIRQTAGQMSRLLLSQDHKEEADLCWCCISRC